MKFCFHVGLFICALLISPGGVFLATSFAQEQAPPQVVGDTLPAEQEEGIDAGEIEVGPAVMFAGADEEEKVLAAKRFQLQQLFAVEIEGLNTVCDLTDKQRTKLKIGVKGIIKKLVEEWRENSGMIIGAIQPQTIDGDEESADEEEEEDEADEESVEIVYTDVDEFDEDVFYEIIYDDSEEPKVAPTRHEFWLKMLDSTLTDEQKALIETDRQERREKLQEAQQQSFLFSVSAQLMLEPEQEAKLRDVIKPMIGHLDYSGPALYRPFIPYYEASKIEAAELQEFLSEAQVQQWKLMMLPMQGIAMELGAYLEE